MTVGFLGSWASDFTWIARHRSSYCPIPSPFNHLLVIRSARTNVSASINNKPSQRPSSRSPQPCTSDDVDNICHTSHVHRATHPYSWDWLRLTNVRLHISSSNRKFTTAKNSDRIEVSCICNISWRYLMSLSSSVYVQHAYTWFEIHLVRGRWSGYSMN